MTARSRAKLGAFGTYLAFFVALLNVSVMYLAVPKVVDTFGADLSLQQWFIGIYPLMQGGFMLAAGTVGDLFGRRRTLIAATAIFALSSIASALAPNLLFLIFARAVEGLSSAALLALPPAMLVALLPSGHEGPTIKRIGIWGGCGRPRAGHRRRDVAWFSWPGVFWLRPGSLSRSSCCSDSTHRREDRQGQEVRRRGQLLSVAAFLLLSYALIDGDAAGGSRRRSGRLVVGAAALWAFLGSKRGSRIRW